MRKLLSSIYFTWEKKLMDLSLPDFISTTFIRRFCLHMARRKKGCSSLSEWRKKKIFDLLPAKQAMTKKKTNRSTHLPSKLISAVFREHSKRLYKIKILIQFACVSSLLCTREKKRQITPPPLPLTQLTMAYFGEGRQIHSPNKYVPLRAGKFDDYPAQ